MRGRSEAGSVTIWMTGLTAVVLVLGGLAVDVWSLVAERSALAAVADAAAVAGASAVDRETWAAEGVVALVPSAACDLARSYAARHVDGLGCQVEGAAVRVDVSRSVPLVLLSLIHPEPVPVAARSEARARLPVPSTP